MLKGSVGKYRFATRLGFNLLVGAGLTGVAALEAVAAPAAAITINRVTFADSVRELPDPVKAALHPMTATHLPDAVSFNLPLALRNQAELEARVQRGEVISGDELRVKYLPLRSDYDAAAAWLQSEGFTVDAVADTNLAVFAHGTVAQVQASFQVKTGLTIANGTEHAVALSAPSLPAAIAGPVLGVSGLSYRRPRSRLAHPAPGSATQPNAIPSGGYHIKDIVTAYNGGNLGVNGTKLTGSGQTIGIEAYVNVKNSDLSTFWTNNSVTRTGTVMTINVNNATLATDAGDVEENALDVEWASGVAPGANIVDYATNYDTNDAPERIYARAVTDAMAGGSTLHTFSSSYGPDEVDLTSTELTAYNNYFMTMTAAGLTFLNATGDYGSANGAGTNPAPEAYGDCPYTTGVGGTSLQVASVTTDVRSSETGWSGSAGGYSNYFAVPAWQTSTGVTNTGSKRMIPDLALDADPGTTSAPAGAYLVYNGKISSVGGTSWSAPTFAGFLALIQQGRTLNTPTRSALGFLNPRLYRLIGTNNFYDATSGSNGKYSATSGYDLVTGVGAPTVSNLLVTWLGPTITSFSPATGTSGTTVVITGTNFYSGPTVPLTVTFNGMAAASVTVNSATQITAVAPSGVTNGPIVVTSFGDTATSPMAFLAGVSDLTVTKTHTGNFTTYDSGDTYTITVMNSGSGATSGTVSMVDYLPSGLTVTGLSGTGWTIGANFLSATRSDSLAAGSSYPPLTLTVNVTTYPTSVTNQVNVSGGGEVNTSNDIAQDVTTIMEPTPSQSWRYQYFGTTANTGNAADTANPSGDGLANLVKYALGLNPLVPTPNPVTESTSSGYLTLTVPKNPNATDVTYTVQVNSDLTNAAGWSSSGTFVMQNSSTTLQVRDTEPVTGANQHFMRLLISR